MITIGCQAPDEELHAYILTLKEEKHRLDVGSQLVGPIYKISASGNDLKARLFPMIPGLRDLHELSLNKFVLTYVDLEIIAKSKAIRRINMQNCQIEAKALAALKTMPSLNALSIIVSNLDDELICELDGFLSLRKLDITANRVTSLRKLSSLELPNLTHLELGSNPIDDDGFRPIQAMTHLIFVNILDTKVTVEGCKLAAPLLGLGGFAMPNMSKEERWQVKLAFDQERVEAVKRGEPILPASHYPFSGFELGGFINDSIIERLRRELGTVPGIEEANANGAKRPIPPPDYGR